MLRYLIRIALELIWIDWQYVGSFDTKSLYLYKELFDTYSSNKEFSVKIHCFESRWGTRHARITIRRTGPVSMFNWMHYGDVRKGEVWQSEIYPWLRGRHVSKIPSYRKVKGGKWDFKRILKGIGFGPLNKQEKT